MSTHRRFRQRARSAALVAIGWLLLLGDARRGGADPSDIFPLPNNLQPAVEFWKRVYAEVDTRGGLLHDSTDLSRVYEVFALPESAAEQDAVIRARRGDVQDALAALGRGERTDLSQVQRNLLAQFPRGATPEVFAAASERVRFQRGQADRIRAGLERKGRWEADIVRVLRERGLPAELAALPHVESSFDPSARSLVGASGIWQFMRPTARAFLRIDSAVDERNDPHLASIAAAQLLEQNYRTTGTWPLAITAYNHGTNGVVRATQQLGTRDIAVIVERYRSRSFGFASRNFYAEFLAALEIDRAPERFFGPITRAAPDAPVTVALAVPHDAHSVANAFGVSLGALRDANPALLESVWSGRQAIPKGYRLRVPTDPSAASIQAVLASLPLASRAATSTASRHVVQPGDTLSGIARRYGTSEAAIANANGIRNRDLLRQGTSLALPHSESSSRAAGGASYEVRRGDTLTKIARSHGVQVAALAAANDLADHHSIFAGQTLAVPAP